MFYKIRVKILKFLRSSVIKSLFYNFVRMETSDDVRKKLIKQYVPGKSFVDIGCMFRVNGLFSFFAEECGATKVLAVDIEDNNEFWEEKKRRQSKVEFIKGDIHLEETVNKIGFCDVVFCSGVLYHSPNPISFLVQLRKICKDILILVTMAIPEMSTKNAAVFYPFLESNQKRLWDIGTLQLGINKAFIQTNQYANWFWGLTPSCVGSMLKYSGFKIKERYIRPFQAFFVCSIK